MLTVLDSIKALNQPPILPPNDSLGEPVGFETSKKSVRISSKFFATFVGFRRFWGWLWEVNVLTPIKEICVKILRTGCFASCEIRFRKCWCIFKTYTIKNYEDLSHQGTRTMPDGMYVTDRTFVYECQVQAFGRYRMIRLYYEPSGTVWKMTV